MHDALKFRNENPIELKEDGSLLSKEIGNATIATVITFEYELKSDEEL